MTRPDHVAPGYSTVTPYIMVRDARRVLDFAREVLGAELLRTQDQPDGSLGHTELRVGDSMIMLADSGSEWPEATAALYVYVPDADVAYRRALAAGATSIMEPADQKHGDRQGGVRDVAGNQWWFGSVIGRSAR